MNPINQPTRAVTSRSCWLWVLLSILLLRLPAMAVDDTYINLGYVASGSGAPQIQATNFINEFGAIFDIEYTNTVSSGWLAGLYQNWYYTRNFTNNGDMICNRGFRFDRQIPNVTTHTPATSFYNAGNIFCGVGGFSGTTVGAYVNATNIVLSGTIAAGSDSLIQMSGRFLDLTRGTLSMANSTGNSGNFNIASSPSVTVLDPTNYFPFFQLTPTNASSPAPPGMNLPNTLAYFDVQVTGPTNRLVRMVFVQNQNTNVGYNVYFTAPGFFGTGTAYVEWYGSYFDASSQQMLSNYLYLSDFYAVVATTNIFNIPFSGLPINYSFFSANSPLGLGTPVTSGFPPGFSFPAAGVGQKLTNSYFSALLSGSTVATNTVANGALTNLAGRVEITATNNLNLSLTTIFGMNYLLLKSTNQFDTDGQSSISSPFTDMYLGVTNGNMVISNVLASAIPGWVGTVQADTTLWVYTDTNSGITYDFRLEIVNANLNPVYSPVVQDCVLNASNNLIISDQLTVIRNLSLNCTNLVITANDIYNGAESPFGILNLASPFMFWDLTLPRLRNLTNNGALYSSQVARYGTTAAPYFNLVNNGTISNAVGGVFINAGNFENYGLFTAGTGTFSVRSKTTTMTNGVVIGGGAFTNVSDSWVVSNTVILVGKGMHITATNLLTDGSTTNNFWSLGAANPGNGISPGLTMPLKPALGDLLGTTITNICVSGTKVSDIWAGIDKGSVNAGFLNNAAIGQLILDARGPNPATLFFFGGAGASGGVPGNAIYVDNLILAGFATNLDGGNNVKSLQFSNNLIIYYAQATVNGVSYAEKLNGVNTNGVGGGHLRWVPTYAGKFSSTYIVYPDMTTNRFNAALSASTTIDSDGDGIVNALDPTPFLIPAPSAPLQVIVTPLVSKVSPGVKMLLNSSPQKSIKLLWSTIPNATNYVYFKTNLLSPEWTVLTNFISPQPYGSPATNVWVTEPVSATPHFYQVTVEPRLLYPY